MLEITRKLGLGLTRSEVNPKSRRPKSKGSPKGEIRIRRGLDEADVQRGRAISEFVVYFRFRLRGRRRGRWVAGTLAGSAWPGITSAWFRAARGGCLWARGSFGRC